jgi:hypothetical protein
MTGASTEHIPVAQDGELGDLDDLAVAIEDNVRDERLLAKRIRQLRSGRASGRSWHELLEGKATPPALELATQILGRATHISSSLRRRAARGLRAEGATIEAIGRRFGVSHQRVTTLLRDGRITPGRAEKPRHRLD